MWPESPKHLAWVHSSLKEGKSRRGESPVPSVWYKDIKILRPWPGPLVSHT